MPLTRRPKWTEFGSWNSRRPTSRPASSRSRFTIDGDADGVNSGTAHHAAMFTGPRQHRVFKGAGHNPHSKRRYYFCCVVEGGRSVVQHSKFRVPDDLVSRLKSGM